MNYKSAIESIRSKRKNDLLLYDVRYINALKQCPDLKQIDGQIYSIKSGLENGDLNALEEKRQEILKKLELYEPQPHCGICLDTGYRAEGKLCACVISRFSQEKYQHTFDEFDFSIFCPSDQDTIKRAHTLATAFCAKFPHTKAQNLVLLGGIGTGKTFLASCIADSLTKSGFSVLFCSAFSFVNKMLSYHTAPIAEKLDHISPLIDCDLLIIDDLGTESMLKNVTAEYLYTILNERMRLGLHTLFTTNLDNERLAARYGERFTSRLFNERSSLAFAISNKDLRKKS